MELTKFEQGLKQIVATMHNGNPSHIKKVIEQIRAIMPPTCGKEQRRFLDSLESMQSQRHSQLLAGLDWEIGENSLLLDRDFQGIDLSKVIKGE